jgi:hypothetical protein
MSRESTIMSDQPSKSPKQVVFETTADRVKQLLEQEKEMERIRKLHPNWPNQEREENRKSVLQKIQELEGFFDLVSPFITNIKSYISKTMDQNRITACYFLFGKTSQSFHAIFLLAREGYSYEVMEILRGITESLSLVHIFLDEEEDSSNLKKWFSGQIIDNSIARAAHDKFLNQQAPDTESQIPFKEVQAHIYRLLSHYSHISYGALLDSFDVYNRDFDFQKIAGFHYLNKSGLSFVRGIMESAVIALKHFYRIAGDMATDGQLNAVLVQLAPRMLNDGYNEQIQKQISSMKERFPRR